MHPVTIEIMLECAEKRKAVSNCPRCGGSGKFRTVDHPASTSRYGQHCFQCGDAYKVPRKWNLLTAEEIVELLKVIPSYEEKVAAIGVLQSVKILDTERGQMVSSLLAQSG